MSYIAVTGVKREQGQSYYTGVVLNDDFEVINKLGYLDESNLIRNTLAYSLSPINFSINRSQKLVMDCGDFSRFSTKGSAVVLAELKTRGGKVLGYKLLSCAQLLVINLKLDDILQREQAYGDNEHFLQNGIIRNKTVNCYPRKPFKTIIINDTKRKDKAVESVKAAEDTARKVRKEVAPQTFSAEQLKELNLCESNGLNSRFIRNSKLSPSQMRVLWVSKSKGAYSESFANPKLSTDAMKFYADRIYSKKAAEDCKELLAHPELSVEELFELYGCICEGIPYANYIGKSPVDIRVARDMASTNYWGSSSKFDMDYYDKAVNVAMKIKGF